ncbi:hypothetical protein CUZ56_02895 [Saezia sanguinis]|uniref:Uncharacterized protein n=1 Tax=Saezia sanguinis TaxID=1965230 RepID=A0A433SA30_9BURK|nr:hypothetical protein CUZ56_02895 [Saezia sanguinis]
MKPLKYISEAFLYAGDKNMVLTGQRIWLVNRGYFLE